ncbi:MAG: uL13 family ribosomal protein, partial [Candidatus Saccharimonadales bacterium]
VTGDKLLGKRYYHHSLYPGGLKESSLADKIKKDSTVVLFKAIRGMLPVNKLRDGRLQRLKIYPGAEHPHEPQQPKPISLKKDNE